MILETINFYILDWANFLVRRIPDPIRSSVTGVPRAQLLLCPPKTITDLMSLKGYILKSAGEGSNKQKKRNRDIVVDLVWPRSLLLVLENDHPTRWKKLSSKLLEYKIINDTPFSKSDVNSVLLETQNGFQLHVAKKDDFFALQDMLKPQQIILRDVFSKSAIDQNTLFSFRDSLSRPKRIWLRANMAICILLFAIFVFQFSTGIYDALKQKNAIQHEITTLQTRALMNAKEISGSSNDNGSFDAFYNGLEREPTRIFILHALNEALGDDTWLTELKIQKSQLQLAGITRSNTEELLEIFGKIDVLENIKLSSQAQNSNRNQGSKFSIEADVK